MSKVQPPQEMLVGNSLGAFITDKELPPCLDSWKEHLLNKDKNNVGLALRWEAGLCAMDALSTIRDDERQTITNEWAKSVQKMINSNNMLDTFCVERSIISIRIKNKNKGYLNMDEARDLFRYMSLDVSNAVTNATIEEKRALSTPAFIGQPVNVCEDFAIVRIALGVESMLSYAKDKADTLIDDEITVRKLGAIAKYFDALKNSGI